VVPPLDPLLALLPAPMLAPLLEPPAPESEPLALLPLLDEPPLLTPESPLELDPFGRGPLESAHAARVVASMAMNPQARERLLANATCMITRFGIGLDGSEMCRVAAILRGGDARLHPVVVRNGRAPLANQSTVSKQSIRYRSNRQINGPRARAASFLRPDDFALL